MFVHAYIRSVKCFECNSVHKFYLYDLCTPAYSGKLHYVLNEVTSDPFYLLFTTVYSSFVICLYTAVYPTTFICVAYNYFYQPRYIFVYNRLYYSLSIVEQNKWTMNTYRRNSSRQSL